MRGNPADAQHSRRHIRSIPAYAGEPRSRLRQSPGCPVYPRVCGGTGCHPGCTCIAEGLSPRMRGNPTRRAYALCHHGSIPAYAGEPAWLTPAGNGMSVYPRVCGGTGGVIIGRRPDPGLSPRMRGNPAGVAQVTPGVGSIPAYAGEPSASMRTESWPAVYPRVCGGTSWVSWSASASVGLSPRMRGNRLQSAPRANCARSIPAYAGEPRS